MSLTLQDVEEFAAFYSNVIARSKHTATASTSESSPQKNKSVETKSASKLEVIR
jgi:hypothetical protein